ncbi:MAG: insulinase family protein [Candidatus Eremiobacteraeota bacterium]|nr:insulinase family protein [Candidatus Eremiobacteraeota bacterium]
MKWRGFFAALFFVLACMVGPARAGAATTSQLSDGLTIVTRSQALFPTVAFQIWIRCPADGYAGAQPGIARLTALALLEQKSGDDTLRDAVRHAGGQVGVSVYHEGTEIALLAPSYIALALADQLLRAVLHPNVDRVAYLAARQRLAAQQVAALEVPDQILRDSLFAQMFASGPLHDPTYGTARTLAAFTPADVNAFLRQAYVPADEIVVAVGNADGTDFERRTRALAPPARMPNAMPGSAVAPARAAPLIVEVAQAASPGVALGWVGPPISDERAATAMDFLSDYLTHPDAGIIAQSVRQLAPGAAFAGQFITMRDPGVFFISVTGHNLDPDAAVATVRTSLAHALSSRLSQSDFAQGLQAFQSRLLRDTQTSQQVADNYGWYFMQGAPAYSPSFSQDAAAGAYFDQLKTLTPQYVYDIARRYLSAQPTVVVVPAPAVTPSPAPKTPLTS